MTLHDHVISARDRLIRAGIGSATAAVEAELLARHVLGWDRATYISNRHLPVGPDFTSGYERLIVRRERREPLPFITGSREFWGLEFEISRHVLIPRSETELLVQQALDSYAGPQPRRIIDVGTGSGCLAVALALEFTGAQVLATDRSPAALRVARRNAERHGVSERIRFVCTHFLEGLTIQADLIVSNPPYVPASAAPALQPEVRDYEPGLAVFAGPDGLDSFRAMLPQVARSLSPDGILLLEFGYGQDDALRQLIGAQPELVLVRIREDLQGIPRVAVLRRASREMSG